MKQHMDEFTKPFGAKVSGWYLIFNHLIVCMGYVQGNSSYVTKTRFAEV